MRELNVRPWNVRAGDRVTLSRETGHGIERYTATVSGSPVRTRSVFTREAKYRIPLNAAPWWWMEPSLTAFSGERVRVYR
jgi:hypothetical protein